MFVHIFINGFNDLMLSLEQVPVVSTCFCHPHDNCEGRHVVHHEGSLDDHP